MLDWLAEVSAPWNTLYSESPVVSTSVLFVHLGAIVLAAASALQADRAALRCINSEEGRTGYLNSAESVHRVVAISLAVAITAGVFLFLADVEALGGSPIFGAKLLLIVLLLSNGVAIMKIEKRLGKNRDSLSTASAWRPLGVTARISQTLWFATILAGVALRNV